MIWYVFAMIQYRSFILSLACLVALVLVSACATSEGSGEQSQLALDTIHEAEKIIEANKDLCERGSDFLCLDIPVLVASHPVTESKRRYERPYEKYEQSFVYSASEFTYKYWIESCSTSSALASGIIIVMCENYLRNEADKNHVAWVIGHEMAHITIRDLNHDGFGSGSDLCKIRRVKSKDLSRQDLDNIKAALAEERKADYYGFYFAVRAGYNYKDIGRVHHSHWGHGASTSRCHDGEETQDRVFSFIRKEIEYLMENDLPIVPQKHNFFERYWEEQNFSETQPASSARHDFNLAVDNHDIGNIAYKRGEHEKAEELYFKALELYEASYDGRGAADSAYNIARIAKHRGDDEKAEQFYSKAAEIYEASGYTEKAADTYNTIGNRAFYRGTDENNPKRLEKAEQFYSKAAELYEALGNTKKATSIYSDIGDHAFDRGDYEKAEQFYSKIAEIYEASKNIKSATNTYRNLILVAKRRGDNKSACKYFKKAKSLNAKAETNHSLDYIQELVSSYGCK